MGMATYWPIGRAAILPPSGLASPFRCTARMRQTASSPSAITAATWSTIRMVDPNVPLTTVWATRGKVVRAEPAAVLYEQSRIHHVGSFPTLEDQMCGFTSDFDRATAGFSPDRVDALVWALTDLLVEPMPYEGLMQFLREQSQAAREDAQQSDRT